MNKREIVAKLKELGFDLPDHYCNLDRADDVLEDLVIIDKEETK